MKNNISKPSRKMITASGKNQIENEQYYDSQTICYFLTSGQTKSIKPIDNHSYVVEKLIKFLKSE